MMVNATQMLPYRGSLVLFVLPTLVWMGNKSAGLESQSQEEMVYLRGGVLVLYVL